jgi:cation diffusion facilitator CzcD-associated flavoprotein CzcO
VIGAGPSGLAAAKQLLEAGMTRVTVFEKGSRVGGNWVYSPEESHSSVFETTHLISSKRLSQSSDFPMPREYPDYPSHRQLLRYFEDYAARFELERVIRFGAEVVRAAKLPGERWEIALAGGEVDSFDHLLVCNGHHWLPRWPKYPGSFSGPLIHSHQFKTSDPFLGRRVLVIGGGNSACDIAVETCRVAEHVGISWRRGYFVIPKLVFGTPPDVFAGRSRRLPAWIRQRVLTWMWRVTTGGTAPYGLPKPDHPILASHPVVNSELLYFMRHGRIHPYPDVRRFDDDVIEFTDGRREAFDSVIAATGFRIAVPFLDRSVVDFDKEDVPLYLRMFHPDHPTLFFIGLIQPAGCIWPLAEAQARLAAAWIAGRWQRPSRIKALAEGALRRHRGRYIDSPRHTIEVDYHEHLSELRRAFRVGA